MFSTTGQETLELPVIIDVVLNFSGNAATRTKPHDNIAEHDSRRTHAETKNTHTGSSTSREPSLAEKLVSSNKSKARFESWLKAKNGKDPQQTIEESDTDGIVNSGVYRSERYTDNYYTDKPYRDHKGSGEVNVLRVPSTRPAEFASPDLGFDSEDETGEITAATLLSPEDFDSRADDIIAKVKGDMKISNVQSSTSNVLDEVRKSIPARKRASNEVQPQTDGSLSSHVCPNCDKLMVQFNIHVV